MGMPPSQDSLIQFPIPITIRAQSLFEKVVSFGAWTSQIIQALGRGKASSLGQLRWLAQIQASRKGHVKNIARILVRSFVG